MTRSGTTLLRLMLDSHPDLAIPGETHWVPKLIKAFERSQQSGEDAANLAIDHKRWGDFHLDADELRARIDALDPVTAADSIRAFYMLYAEREGKSPLRRQDARLRARRCGGSSGCCPRRASSTSSATAATSRSRTCG